MDDRTSQMVALAQGGMKYREIGERFGLSVERIGRILRPILGRKTIYDHLSEREIKALLRMTKAGIHPAEIGRRIGRHSTNVIYHCKKRGVPPSLLHADKTARDKAIRLVKKGKTYTQAAAATGLTRNAVAGAVFRANRG